MGSTAPEESAPTDLVLDIKHFAVHDGPGIVTGAAPDGRKGRGSPPTSLQPWGGCQGALRLFKSTTRVNQKLTVNGTALDLDVHPSTLGVPAGVEKLMSLIKCFRDLEEMQVQFNVIDTEVLREA